MNSVYFSRGPQKPSVSPLGGRAFQLKTMLLNADVGKVLS